MCLTCQSCVLSCVCCLPERTDYAHTAAWPNTMKPLGPRSWEAFSWASSPGYFMHETSFHVHPRMGVSFEFDRLHFPCCLHDLIKLSCMLAGSFMMAWLGCKHVALCWVSSLLSHLQYWLFCRFLKFKYMRFVDDDNN